MRSWTLHMPPAGRHETPALIPERFTWAAAIFGLFWLMVNRIWWAAGGLLGVLLLLAALLPPGPALAGVVALHLLLGFHAQDLRRAALRMRGWTPGGLVLARTADDALGRLLAARPELAAPWARAVLPAKDGPQVAA